jgi:hypothetical protein
MGLNAAQMGPLNAEQGAEQGAAEQGAGRFLREQPAEQGAEQGAGRFLREQAGHAESLLQIT